jgi:hypothetical protein
VQVSERLHGCQSSVVRSLGWQWPPFFKGCCMQVGGYRPRFRPHRGVICRPVWAARLTGLRLPYSSAPASHCWAHPLRGKQITFRCGLVLGSTRCSGPGLHRTSTSPLLLYGVHTCSSPISVGFHHPAAPCRQGAEVMLCRRLSDKNTIARFPNWTLRIRTVCLPYDYFATVPGSTS